MLHAPNSAVIIASETKLYFDVNAVAVAGQHVPLRRTTLDAPCHETSTRYADVPRN